MYDSGQRSPVSFFDHAFGFAGTWGYQDTINGDTASIGVPVNAPATGAVGSRIPVTWATQAPPTGLFFDVQYLPPGGSEWVTWKDGVKATHGSLLASGVGTYQFRARIRDQGHTAGPDWSPPVSVLVS